MKNLFFWLAIAAVILANVHSYNRGLIDGENNYKYSHRMYLALKSAYMFGWYDGHNGKPNDWDGDLQ